MDVIVFTLNDCGHCKDLKMRLINAQISFKDFEINQHRPFWDDIVKQTSVDVVPTLYLTDNINKKSYILIAGKDFHNGDEAINLIKKYTL